MVDFVYLYSSLAKESDRSVNTVTALSFVRHSRAYGVTIPNGATIAVSSEQFCHWTYAQI